jgi:undecaprenyl pyrophosphate phosphatase UppP
VESATRTPRPDLPDRSTCGDHRRAQILALWPGTSRTLVTIAAVRWLVSILRTHPLSVSGWYRIGIAVTVAGFIAISAV